MKCTDFQNQIDEYCSGDLSPGSESNCAAHLAGCSECADFVDGYNSLKESLKAMPVFGPSEGFSERVLIVAADQNGRRNPHHGFMVGFGSATAAALALWVVIGLNPAPTQPTGNSPEIAKGIDQKNIPVFSIALNERRDIKLAFFSGEELKAATITLQLPENVALVGYEKQREFTWKTNLAKGDNLLRLPVVATGIEGGQLVARIEYKGKTKTLKVNLAIGATIDSPNETPGISGGFEFNNRIG